MSDHRTTGLSHPLPEVLSLQRQVVALHAVLEGVALSEVTV